MCCILYKERKIKRIVYGKMHWKTKKKVGLDVFSKDRLDKLDEQTQSNISDVFPEWTSSVFPASFRASHVVILNSHWKMHIRARCACRWINEVCHVVERLL